MWRQLLWPFGLLFMLIAWLRGLCYDFGLLKSKKLGRPVIALGNISTGGTGKTPWVQALSDHFTEQGKQVTILSRGYSGDFDGVLEVFPDMDPRKCGDEPLWLSQKTKARVMVGRNRWLAGTRALQKGDADIFVLDDAFQHRKLYRDLDIVLLDASAPRHSYWPLPVGYLREGFMSLQRADLIIVNKANYGDTEQIQWLEKNCLRFCKKESIYYSDFIFSHFDPMGEELEKEELGGNVAMSCGVGNPKAFLKTLEEQGIDPVRKFIFPDHYYWKPADIERMTYNMKVENCSDLIITEKDAVKLYRYNKHFKEMSIQIWVCKMKIEIKDPSQDFYRKIDGVLS